MTLNRSHALSRDEIVHVLTSYSGWATGAGAADGSTIVDTNLIGSNDFITGKSILIMSGASLFEICEASAFNPATGQITLALPHFSSQITAGVLYRVVNFASGTSLFILLSILQGLVYYGVVTAIPGANQFTIPTLAGLGAGKFDGVTAPYRAFVFRDAGGAGAAPQGEMQTITAYVNTAGTFTSNAFTVAVAAGDEIILLHPRLAEIATILADMNVPAGDAVANAIIRDVIGNKGSTAVYTPDNASDIIRYLKGILNTLNMGTRPLVNLYEGWQDEGGIDATVWTTAITGTGAVARDVTEPPYLKVLLSGPANADTARLYGNQRWVCGPDTYSTNAILRRLVMEFEVKFAVVASIDNPTFFMGLASIQLATRASTNLMGFILNADVLNSITDDGVGETTKAVGAPVLTNWHKYKIEVLAGTVYFYIDEVLVATHTTVAIERLPDTAMFPVFYLPQEAAANGGQLHTGIIRGWTEDIPR